MSRCLFVSLLQFGGNENISTTPDHNQDQRKLNWSRQRRNFKIYAPLSNCQSKLVQSTVDSWFNVVFRYIFFWKLWRLNLITFSHHLIRCSEKVWWQRSKYRGNKLRRTRNPGDRDCVIIKVTSEYTKLIIDNNHEIATWGPLTFPLPQCQQQSSWSFPALCGKVTLSWTSQ